MTRGVVYLAVGKRQKEGALRLAASLHSLRQHWSGAIAILTDQPAVWQFHADSSAAEIVQVNPDPQLRNPANHLKSQVGALSPFDSSVFLDWDTLIAGDIEPIFPLRDEIVVTQHADQDFGNSQARATYESLIQSGLAKVSRIQRLFASGIPCINTGVFGINKSWPRTQTWGDWSKQLDDHWLRDEAALQLMLPDVPYRLLPETFNWVVPFHPPLTTPGDVVIWHCQGGKVGLGPAAKLWAQTVVQMVDTNWAGLGHLDVSLLREL